MFVTARAIRVPAARAIPDRVAPLMTAQVALHTVAPVELATPDRVVASTTALAGMRMRVPAGHATRVRAAQLMTAQAVLLIPALVARATRVRADLATQVRAVQVDSAPRCANDGYAISDCRLTIRSSRNRFVPAKTWQKKLAMFLPPLRVSA